MQVEWPMRRKGILKTIIAFLTLVAAGLTLVPILAEANQGDFSGPVAIGSSYAGQITAPANGLIVEGIVGIGSAAPSAPLDIQTGGTNNLRFGNDVGSATYSAISFNSSFADQGILGILGGGTTDTSLYLYTPATGTVQVRIGGASAGAVFAAGSGVSIGTGFGHSSPPLNGLIVQGSAGIGTAAPRSGAALDVNGTLRVASFTTGSSTTVCQNGNVLSSCTSALRFKENIKPYSMGLKEVLEMKPVTFDQRDHADGWEKHDFGFIAEDMENINPVFVTYDEKGNINGVRYMQMTAVNTKAIQEMQAEIDDLKRTIEELKHQQ